MDGVLCNSEQPSRLAVVSIFAELGVSVTTDDFVPFMGTGIPLFLPPILIEVKYSPNFVEYPKSSGDSSYIVN
ncbi:hypothetical protein KSP40_PGU006173 [Platanthera guangdongensis]|uniref:Uncharacterized protein n=1 Tax=Platanthera guangdongensis TaxID=2320717 RepID=A0ABR2MZL2_9ASPA